MLKRLLLALLTLGLSLALPSSGQAQTQTSSDSSSTEPRYYSVKKGETEAAVVKRFGLSVDEFRRLNTTLLKRKDHHLIPFEQLNINRHTDPSFLGSYRWQFLEGDPAGPSLVPLYEQHQDSLLFIRIEARLRKQIPIFNIPEEAKQRFLSQLEWQEPRIVRLISSDDSLLVLDGLIFGGASKASKLKYWDGSTVCIWKKKGTAHRVHFQLAAIYDDVLVSSEGYGYRLILFLGCQNGAITKWQLPAEPVPTPVVPETTKVIVPCPPPETLFIAPPTPVAPSVSTPVVNNRYYLSDQVTWLTLEDVRLDDQKGMFAGRHQDNLFAGHEHTWWHNTSKRLGLRGRLSGGLFDLKNTSYDANLGLTVSPISNARFRADLEGGPGYTAMERSYWDSWQDSNGQWQWGEKKRVTDGLWLYGRSQLIMPLNTYADLKIRGSKPLTEQGGFVTMRPGWLYLKAGLDDQVRHAVNRHVDERTIPFAADTMLMREGRVGIIWSPWFLTYGSWNDWRYRSDSYDFSRFGPGGGFEWNFSGTPVWRLDGDAIRFRDFDDALWSEDGRLVHHLSHNREWRLKLGLVWAPQTKYHYTTK